MKRTAVVFWFLATCSRASFTPHAAMPLEQRRSMNYPLLKGRAESTTRTRPMTQIQLQLSPQDEQVAIWIAAFSTAHIGMSAIRETIIQSCGDFATNANLVNRGIKLPDFWPGDDFGKSDIFPDASTAGRQLYRLGYTIVSFLTLGNAFVAYIHDDEMNSMVLTGLDNDFYYAVASISFAAAISSLFNASPLSLMPSFQKATDDNDIGKGDIGGMQRYDALKMEPKGLTRITRHPLILPVVPWGISTSFLIGGRTCDFLFFGGLALYAIAGCACQDLRIIRKEGSVGTVMKLTSSPNGTTLRDFYDQTSFYPFAAIIDGRQSMSALVRELPLTPFILGIPIGLLLEKQITHLLGM